MSQCNAGTAEFVLAEVQAAGRKRMGAARVPSAGGASPQAFAWDDAPPAYRSARTPRR